MTEGKDKDNDRRNGRDCHAALAMTERGRIKAMTGAGEKIATLRSQ